MKVTKDKEKKLKTGIAKNISDLISDYEPKDGESKMTLERLSEKSGVSLPKLKRIASGERDDNGNKRLPNSDELFDIAMALNVSPYKLLTGNDDENHVVCDALGLSNDTVNRLKTMKNAMVKQVIDVLVSDWSILMHLSEYLNSDFTTVQRNTTFEFFPVSELSGFDRDDLERVNRLRLLDDLQRIREEIKGGKSK